MVYSEYEMLCKMFLSHKLAAESNKVGAISFNTLGKGVVGISLKNGEDKTFKEYSEARDWCINKGVKYVV